MRRSRWRARVRPRFRGRRTGRRTGKPAGWVPLALVVGTGIASLAALPGPCGTQRCNIAEVVDSLRRNPAFLATDGSVLAFKDPRRGRFVTAREARYAAIALVASEDRRFFERHVPAVDVVAVARAALANIRAGSIRQGGSGIPQQLARTIFPIPYTGWLRKAAEAALAASLSWRYTREELLALYLSSVPLGVGNGVDVTARRLFGKPADALELGEAALLGALPPAPTRRIRLAARHADSARAHRDRVLRKVAEVGQVPAGLVEDELSRALRVLPAERRWQPVSTLSDYLRRGLASCARGTSDVPTTINTRFQADLVELVRRLPPAGATAGAVAIAPDGRLLAAAGDFAEMDGAGSLQKAFIYALALEHGVIARGQLAASVVAPKLDSRTARWRARQTRNGDQGLTFEQALARSTTGPFVDLYGHLPAPARQDFARFGLRVPSRYLASALGIDEHNLLTLASAFGSFVNEGVVTAPWAIAGCAQTGRPGVSPNTATAAFEALQETLRSGTAARAAASVWPNRSVPVGAKTGTDERAGVIRVQTVVLLTPHVVLAVRVRSRQGLRGGAGATVAPIALAVLRGWYEARAFEREGGV